MVQGRHPGPSDAVLNKVEQFHLDSVACGVSALAAGANAPTVLRREALEYRVADGARAACRCSASTVRVAAGEGGAGLLVGGAGVGRQRHELRLQPGARGDGRRVWAQRFLSGRRGGRATGRL